MASIQDFFKIFYVSESSSVMLWIYFGLAIFALLLLFGVLIFGKKSKAEVVEGPIKDEESVLEKPKLAVKITESELNKPVLKPELTDPTPVQEEVYSEVYLEKKSIAEKPIKETPDEALAAIYEKLKQNTQTIRPIPETQEIVSEPDFAEAQPITDQFSINPDIFKIIGQTRELDTIDPDLTPEDIHQTREFTKKSVREDSEPVVLTPEDIRSKLASLQSGALDDIDEMLVSRTANHQTLEASEHKNNFY